MKVRAIGKQVLLLLPILWIVACKVGPNYKTPKTTVPDQFVAASHPQTAPLANWWTALKDPVLDSLIERAVRGNLDLQLAQARVREARAQRGVVKGDLLPDVDASGSYQRSRFSKNSFPDDTGGSTNSVDGDLYQAGFDASWEIDVFGRVRRNIEAADADIESAIEDRRNILVTLLAEVARNYTDLRAAQRQADIARANLKAQQETMELTRVRFEAGLVSNLDVARAEAQVQTTASQIPQFEITERQSIHLLSVLVGREPAALVQALSAKSAIPNTPPEVPVGLPSELVRRRPDIRRAERDLAAATARIGVATADLFPRFSITGALGLSSAKIGNLGESDSGFWSIIPGVSLPIFNRGRIRSNIAVQNAREEQALTVYEQTVLTSLREVEDALVAFSKDRNRRQTLARAVDANRRAVDLANQLYRQGLTDFLSVLQSQKDLFESEDSLTQSDRSVTADFIALYKALGGGWEIEATAQPPSPQGKPGERKVDVSSKSKLE
jgi:outer membrane protein, multidrug efflux system